MTADSAQSLVGHQMTAVKLWMSGHCTCRWPVVFDPGYPNARGSPKNLSWQAELEEESL